MQITYRNIYLQISYPAHVKDSSNSVRRQKAQLRHRRRLEQTLRKEDVWMAKTHMMEILSVFRHLWEMPRKATRKWRCVRLRKAVTETGEWERGRAGGTMGSSHVAFGNTTWYGHSGKPFFSFFYNETYTCQTTQGPHSWVFTPEERKLTLTPKRVYSSTVHNCENTRATETTFRG